MIISLNATLTYLTKPDNYEHNKWKKTHSEATDIEYTEEASINYQLTL